jgi:hypothetical protein
VKHFTNRLSTSDLLLLKKQIEEEVDLTISNYKQYRHDGNDEQANRLLLQILNSERYFSNEGIPLSQDTMDKFASIWV